jgi:hypothetical protein
MDVYHSFVITPSTGRGYVGYVARIVTLLVPAAHGMARAYPLFRMPYGVEKDMTHPLYIINPRALH